MFETKRAGKGGNSDHAIPELSTSSNSDVLTAMVKAGGPSLRHHDGSRLEVLVQETEDFFQGANP